MQHPQEKLNPLLHELEPYHARLVAVSKTKPAEDIKALHEAGQKIFGENYVRELAVYPKVWAIGTVGVDEEAEMDTALQEQLLEKQLAIAAEVGKPVLIRLSKKYDNLVAYLKKYPVPFILEHFAGNAAQAKELLEHRVWFAFGKAFIHPVSDMHAVIRSIPLDRLFLETGHYTLFNISHAYHHASLLLDKQVDELKEQLFENFVTVFRNTASR